MQEIVPVAFCPLEGGGGGGQTYCHQAYNTDIIENQSVGDLYFPLLRSVRITRGNNDTVSVRYDKPHYASFNKSLITDITVELKDDRNREIPFSYRKVDVKLHFRPVKQAVL